MPILDVAIAEAREPQIVPEARYRLECTAATGRLTKKGDRNMIVSTWLITNPPKSINHPKPIMCFNVLPNANDYQEKPEMANDWVVRAIRMCHAAGYKPKGTTIDTDQLIGKRCEVAVGVGTDQNGEQVNEPVWPKFE